MLAGIGLRAVHLPVGLPAKAFDQRRGSAAFEDRPELGAPRRKLADRAGEINVDGLPVLAGPAHQVIERDRVAARRNELGADDAARAAFLCRRLDLEALARVAVET